MTRVLKIELFRMKNTPILAVMLLILILFFTVSIFTNVYPDLNWLIKNICGDSMVFLAAGAIYAGLSVTTDFSSGFVRHYLISGIRRDHIMLSKYLCYLAGCMCLLVFYPLAAFILGYFHIGGQDFVYYFYRLLWNIFATVPFYMIVFTIFFVVAVMIKKDALVIGVDFVLAIAITVLPQRFFADYDMAAYIPTIQIQKIITTQTLALDFYGSLLCGILLSGSLLMIAMKAWKKYDF